MSTSIIGLNAYDTTAHAHPDEADPTSTVLALTDGANQSQSLIGGTSAQIAALAYRIAVTVAELTTTVIPPVHLMLDLSTAHLPEHLGNTERPGLNGHDGVTAYRLRHGWLVWVPDDPQEHAEDYGDPAQLDGVPPELLAVQLHARDLGCDWIMFDADASVIAGLPTWHW